MSHQLAAMACGLSLAGRVNYANASACQLAGEAILAELPADGVWVGDLSALETGNSVTAAVLMGWQRFAASRGSQLRLANAPERLLAILAASNLDTVFAVGRTSQGHDAS